MLPGSCRVGLAFGSDTVLCVHDTSPLHFVLKFAQMKPTNCKMQSVWQTGVCLQKLEYGVLWHINNPGRSTDLNSLEHGVLLHGQPGTGKTMLARALAQKCDVTFYNVTAADLTGQYQGNNSKLVKILFDEALQNQPAIVLIGAQLSTTTPTALAQMSVCLRTEATACAQLVQLGTRLRHGCVLHVIGSNSLLSCCTALRLT